MILSLDLSTISLYPLYLSNNVIFNHSTIISQVQYFQTLRSVFVSHQQERDQFKNLLLHISLAREPKKRIFLNNFYRKNNLKLRNMCERNSRNNLKLRNNDIDNATLSAFNYFVDNDKICKKINKNKIITVIL